jgi:hypothetical protein
MQRSGYTYSVHLYKAKKEGAMFNYSSMHHHIFFVLALQPRNIRLPNKAMGGRTPPPTPLAINLMWCRTVLISLKVMKIAQIPSKGVLRRGRVRLPVSFAGVLHRVMVMGPVVA